MRGQLKFNTHTSTSWMYVIEDHGGGSLSVDTGMPVDSDLRDVMAWAEEFDNRWGEALAEVQGYSSASGSFPIELVTDPKEPEVLS